MYDIIIIGAGLVGLGIANALQEHNPQLRLLVLDKENKVAAHQSGHNSNVVHSGIYYTPGSLKARLAKQRKELPLLENIYQRGLQNGLVMY
ncbi:FAD-dependent oxidoreductase [Xenorhabdus khoisanae]|nr:FAD-dependent oxidoreductase [Xenorhabdus khoisanae]MDC9613161.1 FAD-dependent oxidoreductase [Xenorhabdus khoisanae]